MTRAVLTECWALEKLSAEKAADPKRSTAAGKTEVAAGGEHQNLYAGEAEMVVKEKLLVKEPEARLAPRLPRLTSDGRLSFSTRVRGTKQ